MSANAMTAAGLAALQAEIARLETDGRAAIAEEIKVARGYGDLSENAEYHAAKEAQAHLETRIAVLRDRLLAAEVVEPTRGNVVGFGSTVTLADEATGKELRYTLVSQSDQDAARGQLSVDTPVAVALMGKKAGEVAVVAAPRGERRLRVVAVS